MTIKDTDTLIIGNGRLAGHLCNFFKSKEIPFTQWHRHSNTNSIQDLKNAASPAKRILLCISDGMISDFISQHEELFTHKTLVHFSATVSDSRILGFHPLGSFSHDINVDFSSIHFHGVHPESLFREALPMLKNPYARLSSEDLKLYHALCVVGGNFTSLLWREFFREMQKLGIQQDALFSYLSLVSKNILTNPEKATTGPLIRGDLKTIESNMDSLSFKAPHLSQIYNVFVNTFAKQLERN